MYLLAMPLIGRDFFLRPDYIAFVPGRVRAHHARRFAEVHEGLAAIPLT
jgi:intracellular multiplication protein IcmB